MIELGDDIRRDDDGVAHVDEGGPHLLMARFALAEQGEQAARVGDDHRSPNPARCAPTSSAISTSLANSAVRGGGCPEATASATARRMTSASEIDRRRADAVTAL